MWVSLSQQAQVSNVLILKANHIFCSVDATRIHNFIHLTHKVVILLIHTQEHLTVFQTMG